MFLRLLPAALVAAPAFAAMQCGPITVEAADPSLAAHICQVAPRALRDMESCNLPAPGPLTITVVDDIQNECLGLFHCSEYRIEILAPDVLAQRRKSDGLFAPVPNERFFDSIIVHELAHAAYDATPCPFQSCIATDEYVAYTVMIRTLPEDVRAEVIGDTTQKVSRSEINRLLLMMAPDVFARKAWLHFSQRPDPCAYMGMIARGDIVFDTERP